MPIFSRTKVIPGFSKGLLKFIAREDKIAESSRRKFLPFWKSHLEINKSNILKLAETIQPENTLILGAGRCNDIPLKELAEIGNVTLMDFNEKAILRAKQEIKSLSLSLAPKINLKAGDISGIIPELVLRAEYDIARSDSYEEAIQRISSLYSKAIKLYKPIDVPSNSMDFTVSSLVISQLNHPSEYIARRMMFKFFKSNLSDDEFHSKWLPAYFMLGSWLTISHIKEIHRILKPEGKAYISTESEVSFEHEGIKITLPFLNKLGDLVSMYFSPSPSLCFSNWSWRFIPEKDLHIMAFALEGKKTDDFRIRPVIEKDFSIDYEISQPG